MKLFTFLLGILIIGPAQSSGFDVQQIADGVYAAVRREPPTLTLNANSVFIVNEEDVVVVDTSLTPTSAQELIRAIRAVTTKPVRTVVNTHAHDDHISGNAAFKAVWPGIEFIAHARTAEYLPGAGLANRKAALAPGGYPQFIEALKKRLASRISVHGGALDDSEQAAYAAALQIAEGFVAAHAQGVEIVLPTRTVEDKLRITSGKRVIDLLYLGMGHTSGDLVIHLPAEGIVVAGDLVVAPVPYVGSPQSHPADWSRSLDKLAALKPKLVIPGHGPVLQGDAHVRTLAALFASVARQVAAAVARGETQEQAAKAVQLNEFERELAGNSRMLKLIFNAYVRGPAVQSAWLDAQVK
jgi:glyoxylase-like metal-dependent hydrolase (beta-lactamase superfamily II)